MQQRGNAERRKGWTLRGGGAMLPEDKAFAVGSFKKQEVVFLV